MDHYKFKDVLEIFFDNYRYETITSLKGGLCNSTFLLESENGKKIVLQKLHPIVTSKIVESEYSICNYMQAKKWQTPLPIISKLGNPYAKIGNDIFRVYEYIEGQNIVSISVKKAKNLGKMLAKFHFDLATIPYNRISSIPNFHDTELYFKQLYSKKTFFQNRSKKEYELFIELLNSWDTISYNKSELQQIIHGDARLQNFLEDSKNNIITIIDYDTFLYGSVFIDIGDLLRSINCDDSQTDIILNDDKIIAIIDGYSDFYKEYLFDFYKNCIKWYKIMSLELAARFMNDIYDDCYFGWNNSKYSSRAENNLARATCQYLIYDHAFNMEKKYA